jgi:hypothetical protein
MPNLLIHILKPINKSSSNTTESFTLREPLIPKDNEKLDNIPNNKIANISINIKKYILLLTSKEI